jgi:hypothetical protein
LKISFKNWGKGSKHPFTCAAKAHLASTRRGVLGVTDARLIVLAMAAPNLLFFVLKY